MCSGAMKSAELGRQKRLYRCVQGGYFGVPASGKSAGMSLPAILTIAMGNLPGKRLQVAAVLGEGGGTRLSTRDAKGLTSSEALIKGEAACRMRTGPSRCGVAACRITTGPARCGWPRAPGGYPGMGMRDAGCGSWEWRVAAGSTIDTGTAGRSSQLWCHAARRAPGAGAQSRSREPRASQ